MMSTISLIQLIQKLEPYYVVIDKHQSIVLVSNALEIKHPNFKSKSTFFELCNCKLNFDSQPKDAVGFIENKQIILHFHYEEDHIICDFNEISIENNKITLRQRNREVEDVLDSEIKLNRRLIQTEGFVRATVHDLGAPINNLKALIKLYEIETEKKESDYLFELIKRSVETLSSRQKYVNQLIKDDYLFDEEAMGPLELHAPLVEIIEEFEPLFKSQKGRIVKDIPIQTVVHFSSTALRSVFENLLSNSLKYKKQDEAPVVVISCAIESKKVTITYTDNGIGMDIAKFNQNPFGLYRRFNEDAASGSGLGLYITKSQIEKAEGHIDIQSEQGQGVTCTITLKIPAK
ncbi:MAG: hypothetical protein GC193_00655 [Cryomorphaceae bacterium]|nr:hypothetical protein [Cryomorphaceae bacterium]